MFKTRSAWLWLTIPIGLILVLLALDSHAHAWVNPGLIGLTLVAGGAPAMDKGARWLWHAVPHWALGRRKARQEVHALWQRLGARPATQDLNLKVPSQAFEALRR